MITVYISLLLANLAFSQVITPADRARAEIAGSASAFVRFGEEWCKHFEYRGIWYMERKYEGRPVKWAGRVVSITDANSTVEIEPWRQGHTFCVISKKVPQFVVHVRDSRQCEQTKPGELLFIQGKMLDIDDTGARLKADVMTIH